MEITSQSIGSLLSLYKLVMLSVLIDCVISSNGDRSYVFGKCVRGCISANCSNLTEFAQTQPYHLYFWGCKDECKYQCMWSTVDAFQKDRSQVPQFFGKVSILQQFFFFIY